jgi:hypothetical protein
VEVFGVVPTTQWETAREEITRPFGTVEFLTTTNLVASNVVLSTELADNYNQNDYFIGWFCLIDGINNVNVLRRVTDYVASSGTLTVAGSVLDGDGESSPVHCTLMKFVHERVRNAFNRARQDVSPHLAIVRDLRTLITGQNQRVYTVPSTFRGKPNRVYIGKRVEADSISENQFTDGGFEIWTSAIDLTHWTDSNHASVNQEVESTSPQNYMVLSGSNSARLVSASGTINTLLETVTPTVAAQSVEVNVSVWVYSKTASRISAQAVTALGSAHGGGGWELLTSTANTAQGATTIDGGVSITNAAAIDYYVDEAIMIVGQSEAVEPRWDEVINYTWIAPAAGASNGGLLEFPFVLPAKDAIRIIGSDMLSSVTADTNTIEIDGELLEPLYDRTRQYICEEESYRGTGKEQSFWWTRAREYKDRADRGLSARHISLPNRRIRSVYGG